MSQTLQDRLQDSEHKRNDQLKRILDLQKKVLELESDNKRIKEKLDDIIKRKASVVLREQLLQLELDYSLIRKEL